MYNRVKNYIMYILYIYIYVIDDIIKIENSIV